MFLVFLLFFLYRLDYWFSCLNCFTLKKTFKFACDLLWKILHNKDMYLDCHDVFQLIISHIHFNNPFFIYRSKSTMYLLYEIQVRNIAVTIKLIVSSCDGGCFCCTSMSLLFLCFLLIVLFFPRIWFITRICLISICFYFRTPVLYCCLYFLLDFLWK